MKVYLLLEFSPIPLQDGVEIETCKVLKVFSDRDSAEERRIRLEETKGNKLDRARVSYAVICKSVNGLLSCGITSKGKIKMIQHTYKDLQNMLKVGQQREYIQRLEHRIQILKDQVRVIDNLRNKDLQGYIDDIHDRSL